MSESLNEEPLRIKRLVIDMFDPTLPVFQEKIINPGQQSFKTNLKNRTWVRVEVWDVAANGAFTQSVWIKR